MHAPCNQLSIHWSFHNADLRLLVLRCATVTGISLHGCHDFCYVVQGLTVELRPYQRQSLKFMMDNEGVQGGFRHRLFCSVTNSKGERYWYSPLLGRICQDVAPMQQGGILGRTLTLVLIVIVCLMMNPMHASEDV